MNARELTAGQGSLQRSHGSWVGDTTKRAHNCGFGIGALVLMADGSEVNIEDVQAGDLVASFDPCVGEGGGALMGRRVLRASRSVSDELTLLSCGAWVVQAQQVLTEGRIFRSVREALSSGARFVASTGDAVELSGEAFRIQNAGYLNEATLAVSVATRWPIFNLEVDGLRTFVSQG